MCVTLKSKYARLWPVGDNIFSGLCLQVLSSFMCVFAFVVSNMSQ